MKTERKLSNVLNIGLWIAQSLLAFTLVWAAGMKWFQSPEKLAEMWTWTADNPLLVKLTGVLDLLAGLGLILPGILKWSSKLTVLTAIGIVLLMISAIVFHVSRGEVSQIGFNIFVALMAVFIAWGRWRSSLIP